MSRGLSVSPLTGVILMVLLTLFLAGLLTLFVMMLISEITLWYPEQFVITVMTM